MADSWKRPAWAEIDLDAIRANARLLAALASPSALCAVVKADAYGHGAVPVARAALEGGATSLAVALVEEGVQLRRAGISAPILLLSEPAAAAMDEVVRHHLVPTLYTDTGVDAVIVAATRASRTIEVEVKLDTGLHRVGADPELARSIVARVVASPVLVYAGLWTHLAVADEPGEAYTAEQISRFDSFRQSLAAGGVPAPARVHAANSAGAIAHPASRYDLVRCGIALYGHLPSAALGPIFAAASEESLRPALRWKTRVSLVRELDRGERPSYGRKRALSARTDVATVPVGYADGVPRALFTAGGELLIGGRRCPIAGVVTMDQLLVECGPDSGVVPGDEVVLIGRQGDEEVSAEEWAERLGTISYEIVCRIGPRLPRVHLEMRSDR